MLCMYDLLDVKSLHRSEKKHTTCVFFVFFYLAFWLLLFEMKLAPKAAEQPTVGIYERIFDVKD